MKYTATKPFTSTQNTKGFTLIELIIVIVILGILAVTAAPRFLDIRSDAILASMDGLEGAIETASHLVFLKAKIDEVEEQESASVTIDGITIDVVYGYPAGSETGILAALDLEAADYNAGERDGDWNQRASTGAGSYVFWHGDIDENAGFDHNCWLRYNQASAQGDKPDIDKTTTDC